jgi:hypothetical protein
MEFSYLYYPPHWKKKAWRRQVLEAAGNTCQMCGIANRTVAHNTDGEQFMIYLQIAHEDQYLTWHPQAATMVLCQPCHRKFDQQNIRRDKADVALTLIGQARISAVYKRRTHLVGVVSTLNELRAIIQAQPVDTVLVVQLEVNGSVVGRGRYVKTHTGLEVVRETGAARNLWMNFIQKQAFRKLSLLRTGTS